MRFFLHIYKEDKSMSYIFCLKIVRPSTIFLGASAIWVQYAQLLKFTIKKRILAFII